MSNTLKVSKTAVIGMIAAGVMVASNQALAGKPGFEKCQGIAKAGMNDCGSSAHSCAGQATKDSDTSEWIYVPKGICGKIVGGTTK